jgi:hypothetical protein
MKRRELFCLAVAPVPVAVAPSLYDFVSEQLGLGGFHMWPTRADHSALSGLTGDYHPQYRIRRR